MGNLANIVASTEFHLNSRIAREPDFQAENGALTRLALEMSERPDQVLHILCQEVMKVCSAESAGVSLIDDVDTENFRWPAIAGAWSPFQNGGMPRAASPCGVVLQQDRSLIFHDVETQFPAAAAASPPIAEILLAPFRVNGKPIGTVWAIDHSGAKQFDREDQRLLESLARFASAAYQMADAVKSADDARTQLRLVNHELGHRLKNMLAIISATAVQTLKNVSEQDAVAKFQARLQALGSAHDILMDRTLVAAPMDVIAQGVFALFGQQERLTIAGPSIVIGPRATLSLSMILHELGTNAIKYGALSVPDGVASFTWSLTDEPEPTITALWQERGGPPVVPPEHKGFGTRLVNLGLTGNGGVTLAYPVEGMRAEFEATLGLAVA